ncbi:hypothetical protein [Kribbella jiaozuonensis]|uniref:hypothetical protein n=1 Tax=Kribbella jiaozuonensis TaxID=2575441 RepID=UPI0014856AB5|nr:hypothetical protein [Kribbella jiaozuonensis]
MTDWWRDADLLRELGPALAGLYGEVPTLVLGAGVARVVGTSCSATGATWSGPVTGC